MGEPGADGSPSLTDVDLRPLAERLARGEAEVTGGGGREPAANTERELSNEDFFWDL